MKEPFTLTLTNAGNDEEDQQRKEQFLLQEAPEEQTVSDPETNQNMHTRETEEIHSVENNEQVNVPVCEDNMRRLERDRRIRSKFKDFILDFKKQNQNPSQEGTSSAMMKNMVSP